jgi:hypothetical protein
MRIRPVLIAGAAGWVKRIPGVILCICIAVLASAGSLYLYSPEPTFRVQSETWSQPYLHQVYDPIHVELETPKKTINQTSLSNFLMSIQSISISDDTPMGQYWIPRNQKYVISQVLTWLKIAAPDTEKIPPLPTVVMAAYLGPSQLHLTTPDNRRLSIYPAYYYTFLSAIRDFDKAGKIIASICVGALPVGKSGVLHGRKGTTYHLNNGLRQKQLAAFGVDVLNQPIVVDSNIVTSSSPAMALEVAFKLLEMLTSQDNCQNVRHLMGF